MTLSHSDATHFARCTTSFKVPSWHLVWQRRQEEFAGLPALSWWALLQQLWTDGPHRTLQPRVSRRVNTFVCSGRRDALREVVHTLLKRRVCSCICCCRYYCVSRAQTPTPTDGLSGAPCLLGHFCPPGSRSPEPCPAGSYMPHTHGEKCHACPEGEYCVPGEKPEPCPQGKLGFPCWAWFSVHFSETANSDQFFFFPQGISVPRAQLFQWLVQQARITPCKGKPAASPVPKGKSENVTSVLYVGIKNYWK